MKNGKRELLNRIVAKLEEKLPQQEAKLAAAFVRQFYNTLSLEDLVEKDFEDLFGSALSLWQLMYHRKPGEANIRIHNPHYERHGWSSTHTILEISHDDMPFLVDSSRLEANRLGYNVHLTIHFGGMKVRRDTGGKLIEILPFDTFVTEDILLEAPIYMEIDRQTDPEALKNLTAGISRVLQDVRIAVKDWSQMRSKIKAALDDMSYPNMPIPAEEIAETKDFLCWVENDHFTFLGYRDYEFVGEGDEYALKLIPESGLGVLRDASQSKLLRLLSDMTPEVRELVISPHTWLYSMKSNTVSTVHRGVYTDYIGIKRIDEQGKIIGERRIIGLYTSAAYNTNPKHIPFLRRKVANVIKNSGLSPVGHAGKALLNILETLPRDDLFQASTDELTELSLGILHLQDRQRIRLFTRKDIYRRFISCLVYVPRERFNTELRRAMAAILEKSFHAIDISFNTLFSEAALARIHFMVRIDPSAPVNFNIKSIEAELIEVGRSWRDDLRDNLLDHFGEERGNSLFQRYRYAFPAAYREDYQARIAAYDIDRTESIAGSNDIAMSFYRPLEETTDTLRIKLFHPNTTTPLSDVLPILENMGLRVISERPYRLRYADGSFSWINDFGVVYDKDLNGTFDIDQIKDIFQEGFSSIWFGKAEDDAFNRLILDAQLSFRQISVLRAYTKYLRQISFTFSQDYIAETMNSNPSIARQLIELFIRRFNPSRRGNSKREIKKLIHLIHTELDSVANLDQDRILRRFLDLILATIRTNYFQINGKQGEHKPYISFKFDCEAIPDLPLPKPLYEIFIYSPRFEGVHLRSGKVARGGLRWSDRREDFRTEILGLMKAQRVKNAVIVPSGAKGGFVPKCLPNDGSREEILAEGIECYKYFISGLLDLTDNRKNGKLIPPNRVVSYDEEDSYLVVAADKGTATFSDIANSVARDYDFWLDDAFASGGSTGYDHKKMGITAKGAWESVKRHFRELDINIQTTDFTVVGVGDMAGDVFGNGMLLSRHIKLVGAFNHLHIFLDPNPDSEQSFVERERLFNLSRSSWMDYKQELISEGGGIFRRTDKSIKLSAPVKEMLGVEKDYMVPNELIRAMIKAPVDLFWSGGIGTFAKARSESHDDAGDRSNDAIRVNGIELQCRVISEGGNLGFTQLARVEYALHGGSINTDFIDNSAGVDYSDNEVNIKILLNKIVLDGDLTEKQRNLLLVQMTDEVAKLVLKNNYRQTQAITLAYSQANLNTDLYRSYIDEQEREGRIDRDIEFLPDNSTLIERKAEGKSLTRPEISVLLAYSKSIIKDEILETNVPEDEYLSNILAYDFPKVLRERYRSQMEEHSLRREIIATQLSNVMVNEMGVVFAFRTMHETGAPLSAIVRAYAIARNVFDVPTLWSDIESLDNQVPSELQAKLLLEVIRLIHRATRWFLQNRRMQLDIQMTTEQFRGDVEMFQNRLFEFLPEAMQEKLSEQIKFYQKSGLPLPLANRYATLHIYFSALSITQAMLDYQFTIDQITNMYFSVGEYLSLGWFHESVNNLIVENQWEALARESYRDDLDARQRDLSVAILQSTDKIDETKLCLEFWAKQHPILIDRWTDLLANLKSSAAMNYTMLSVAMRELLDLSQTSLAASLKEKRKNK